MKDIVLGGVKLAKEDEVHDGDEHVEGKIGRLKLTLFEREEGAKDGIDALDNGGVGLLTIASDEVHPEEAEGAVGDDRTSFQILLGNEDDVRPPSQVDGRRSNEL
jgi:hypothetical protein